jgi:hypothetical protein
MSVTTTFDISYANGENFKSRFDLMLSGRKATLWIKPLGLSNGTISRISENAIPGPEILTVMQRSENVNVNWLLGGDSRPFMIDTHIDQTSFIDYLNYHSEDADYRIDYLLTENLNTLVVVFSQPASMQFKSKTIGYKHIEVLAGPLNEATLATLQTLKSRHAHCNEFVLSDIQTRQLVRGEFGTYLLFGDNDKNGLIIKGIQTLSNVKINELSGSYGSGKTQAGMQAIKFKEGELSQLVILDEIHQTSDANGLKLLPSQINALANVFAAIGFTGTPNIDQIKSAAALAKLKID